MFKLCKFFNGFLFCASLTVVIWSVSAPAFAGKKECNGTADCNQKSEGCEDKPIGMRNCFLSTGACGCCAG